MNTFWPEKIGPYIVERLLGKGSMSAVYLCKTLSGDRVAIKWIDSNYLPWVKRFHRESEVLKKVNHPNIVRYLGGGVFKHRPFIVMQYVKGLDLRVYTTRLHTRPSEERYRRCKIIGREISMALSHLHELGIVHRDVKPSNILLDQYERAILTDFGTVKDVNEVLEENNIFVGTPAFASPEQINEEPITIKTDQFGLGATMYYILTQRRPYNSLKRTTEVIPPSSLDPEIPLHLENVILKMMASHPKDRYPKTLHIIRALADVQTQSVSLAGGQKTIEEITNVLQFVSDGFNCCVRLIGFSDWGSDKEEKLLKDSAKRRNITVLLTSPEKNMDSEIRNLAKKKSILIIDRQGLDPIDDFQFTTIRIKPLHLAEIRRSIYSTALRTTQLAKASQQLYRLTGGIPPLVLYLLKKYTHRLKFSLPEVIPQPPILKEFIEALPPKERIVLDFLADQTVQQPIEKIENHVGFNPEPQLKSLKNKMVTKELTDSTWKISATLFLKVTDQPVREDSQYNWQVECAEILKLSAQGKLALAHRKAKSLMIKSQEYKQQITCEAMMVLGRVQLDIGLFASANKIFADVSTLAQAEELHEIQKIAHAFRARATLEKQPGSRAAAAAAVDRLLPLIKKHPHPIVLAMWSWAIATLGDTRRWKTSLQKAQNAVASLQPIEKARALFCLVRGACSIADEKAANELIEQADTIITDHHLLEWEFNRVKVLLHNIPPPVTTHLIQGLEPIEVRALKNRWIYARGITPDPTWNNY